MQSCGSLSNPPNGVNWGEGSKYWQEDRTGYQDCITRHNALITLVLAKERITVKN